MVDFFALLRQPRRPWVDPAVLKEQFLTLSALHHPDRVHGGTDAERRDAQERYTQLNSAYHCLRQEKERLAHFLELEQGAKPEPLQHMPPDLVQWSLEISRICHQADALLAEKEKVTSPLLQVSLFERSQGATEQLLELRGRINAWNEQLLSELQGLDQQWSGAARGSGFHAALLERLTGLYRKFSFLSRWLSQLQERAVQLSF